MVDLLGLEKLSNAFGFLLLLQGIGAAVGPPIAGVYHYVLLKLLRPFTGREHYMTTNISQL